MHEWNIFRRIYEFASTPPVNNTYGVTPYGCHMHSRHIYTTQYNTMRNLTPQQLTSVKGSKLLQRITVLPVPTEHES